eukprot:TRINITY_DN18272_c0_g1_i1.p1 TRINITY_DN18272_c0_g1~~TRINITY_DN18272_c0_g1_i1.p1  ORF type:complete len:217 (+),score=39.16 TRINITY_DN18272_c0_g1_i1:92-742(+)
MCIRDRSIPMLRLWLGALAALLIGVWVFSGKETLSGPFLYDDRGTVKVNPVVSEPDTTPWTDALHRDFWGQPMRDSDSHKSFRPVTTLTYRLNSVYFGMQDTTSFHVVNVLLHGITSGVTVFASNALLQNSLGSTLVGLLFATHPVHSEAVSNITGRAELLCALFYLLGFLVYVHGAHHRMFPIRAAAFVLMLACTALSMFSKEQGIMLPLSLIHI